jgi:hypothetical protein
MVSMSIRDIIIEVNDLEAAGIIERYAIGGAVAATFHLEPLATLDVDIFVTFRAEPGRLLVDPKPIFDYFAERGHPVQGDSVMIAGWPVQFLPSTGALVDEALADADVADLDGVAARVFGAEHLAAIALQTGRKKDKGRLLHFIEQGALDGERFLQIIRRHGLVEAWTTFERQFLLP